MRKGSHHVLILEDSADDAMLLEHIFGDITSCSIHLCRNTREAEAYLTGAGVYQDRKAFPYPDAILTGSHLGADSGADFIRWVRGHAGSKPIPITVLTGSASPQEKKELSNAGAGQILGKVIGILEQKSILHEWARGVGVGS